MCWHTARPASSRSPHMSCFNTSLEAGSCMQRCLVAQALSSWVPTYRQHCQVARELCDHSLPVFAPLLPLLLSFASLGPPECQAHMPHNAPTSSSHSGEVFSEVGLLCRVWGSGDRLNSTQQRIVENKVMMCTPAQPGRTCSCIMHVWSRARVRPGHHTPWTAGARAILVPSCMHMLCQ